eukprot:2064325-Amphidinium_carterae.1
MSAPWLEPLISLRDFLTLPLHVEALRTGDENANMSSTVRTSANGVCGKACSHGLRWGFSSSLGDCEAHGEMELTMRASCKWLVRSLLFTVLFRGRDNSLDLAA